MTDDAAGGGLWVPPPATHPPHSLPEGAPAELTIRSEAPRPLLAAEAELGTPLGGVLASDGRERPHRLVIVGDSISQGFQSFAIHNTAKSWPAMVAETFGFEFTFPTFDGPPENPGLPFNLESIAQTVHQSLGDRPFSFDEAAGTEAILRSLAGIREYWHRESRQSGTPQHGFHDNLAVWGFDLRDAMSKTRGISQAAVDQHVGLWDRLDPRRLFFASHANEVTTLRTLRNDDDPSPDVTQASAARALGAENGGAGVDTLVVALGANNALSVVGDLRIEWSGPDFQDVTKKNAYNLWSPSHFATELALLADEMAEVHAARTLWLTVPHVTVVPLLRGVGEKPYYSRYYARYTHAWIPDADYDGNETATLTGDEARMVDSAIDQYNWSIKKLVHDHRERGDDWMIVDLCGLLDRLAYRRYLASPPSRPGWWSETTTETELLPPQLLALSPRPDTRYFLSDKRGRSQGGLIALDGVHPTTIGYGLIAELVTSVLRDVAHVPHADGHSTPEVDWDRIVSDDTLIASPPPQLTEIGALLGRVNAEIDVLETLFGKRPS